MKKCGREAYSDSLLVSCIRFLCRFSVYRSANRYSWVFGYVDSVVPRRISPVRVTGFLNPRDLRDFTRGDLHGFPRASRWIPQPHPALPGAQSECVRALKKVFSPRDLDDFHPIPVGRFGTPRDCLIRARAPRVNVLGAEYKFLSSTHRADFSPRVWTFLELCPSGYPSECPQGCPPG